MQIASNLVRYLTARHTTHFKNKWMAYLSSNAGIGKQNREKQNREYF